MSFTSAIAIYVIFWWLILFMVLPYGARKKIDSSSVKDGQDSGAPAKPMIKPKLLATTVISGVVFGLFYYMVDTGLINFRPPDAGG